METESKPSDELPPEITPAMVAAARKLQSPAPRQFTYEEKAAIVQDLKDSGQSTVAYALKVGIASQVLRRWLHGRFEYPRTRVRAPPQPKQSPPRQPPPRKEEITTMATHKTGTKYTDEFKRAAVARLVNERPVDIVKDLGIAKSLLRGWKAKFSQPKGGEPLRKAYTDDFKRKAVQRVEKGERIKDVSEELGIHTSMVSQWRKRFGKKPPAGKARGPYETGKRPYLRPAEKLMTNGSGDKALMRAVNASIGLLRGIKGKADINDPVHLTALLVLNTLEGKM